MTTPRPAVPNDIEQIYALERACSQNPWTRDGIASSLSSRDSIFWVLENQENGLIAFACSSLILDELHILEVAVHPCRRNAGLGALLINQLIQTAAAKNARRAYLEVRRSNRSAIRLYEKCGFTEDAVRTGYYGDGEDAVFMSAYISELPPHIPTDYF
jgi:ribosomal-protein-alanine N-acetyltransferase